MRGRWKQITRSWMIYWINYAVHPKTRHVINGEEQQDGMYPVDYEVHRNEKFRLRPDVRRLWRIDRRLPRIHRRSYRVLLLPLRQMEMMGRRLIWGRLRRGCWLD